MGSASLFWIICNARETWAMDPEIFTSRWPSLRSPARSVVIDAPHISRNILMFDPPVPMMRPGWKEYSV